MVGVIQMGRSTSSLLVVSSLQSIATDFCDQLTKCLGNRNSSQDSSPVLTFVCLQEAVCDCVFPLFLTTLQVHHPDLSEDGSPLVFLSSHIEPLVLICFCPFPHWPFFQIVDFSPYTEEGTFAFPSWWSKSSGISGLASLTLDMEGTRIESDRHVIWPGTKNKERNVVFFWFFRREDPPSDLCEARWSYVRCL